MIPLSNQTLSDRAGSNIEGEDKFSAYISMLWPDQFGTWIDDDGGLYYDT